MSWILRGQQERHLSPASWMVRGEGSVYPAYHIYIALVTVMLVLLIFKLGYRHYPRFRNLKLTWKVCDVTRIWNGPRPKLTFWKLGWLSHWFPFCFTQGQIDLFFKVLVLLFLFFICKVFLVSSLISTILGREFFLYLMKVFETTVIQILTPT